MCGKTRSGLSYSSFVQTTNLPNFHLGDELCTPFDEDLIFGRAPTNAEDVNISNSNQCEQEALDTRFDTEAPVSPSPHSKEPSNIEFDNASLSSLTELETDSFLTDSSLSTSSNTSGDVSSIQSDRECVWETSPSSVGIKKQDKKRKNSRGHRSGAGTKNRKKRKTNHRKKKRKSGTQHDGDGVHSNSRNILNETVTNNIDTSDLKGSVPGFIGVGHGRRGNREEHPSFEAQGKEGGKGRKGDDANKSDVDTADTEAGEMGEGEAGEITELNDEHDPKPPHDSDQRQFEYNDLPKNVQPIVDRLVGKWGWTYIAELLDKAQVLLDAEGRLVFAKLRQPKGKNWTRVLIEVLRMLKMVRRVHRGEPKRARKKKGKGTASGEAHEPRRMKDESKCPSVSFGFSFGGGQQQPQTLHQTPKMKTAIEKFMDNKYVKEYSKHITILTHAKACLITSEALLAQHVFNDSPYCATTLNLGPKTDTTWHRDYMNLLFGVCAIGVFGKFNHRTSGHIMLKEPKVIMELRHGDVLLVPSAFITHANSGLYRGEKRYSIVQYTAGGLFRWIWNGYKKEEKGQEKEKAFWGGKRWECGWELFPRLSDLQASVDANSRFLGSSEAFINLFTRKDH